MGFPEPGRPYIVFRPCESGSLQRSLGVAFSQVPQGAESPGERRWKACIPRDLVACHSTPQRLPNYLLRQSRLQPLWSLVISPTCRRVLVLCTLLPDASSSAFLSSSSYQLSEVFLTNLSLTVPPTPLFPPYPHSTCFLFLHSTYRQIIYPRFYL